MGVERALVVLTPYESRRLLAKAVAALPAVKAAMMDGRIIVATGSTNGYVAEELLGRTIVKENFISGHITEGETWSTPENPQFIYPIVLYKGVRQDIRYDHALNEFSNQDVFIKGANAVDRHFHAAVFMANNSGGTIGGAIGTLYARGANLVVPVGLEKLIPSVTEAVKHSGILGFRHRMGTSVGLMPIVNATVITEIQAIDILFGLKAYHIGSGGIAGSEGVVILVLEGECNEVDRAYHCIQLIKGEPALKRPNGTPKQ